MKIALCMETSQADKNEIVYMSLKKVAEKYNHTLFNYGVYAPEDSYQISYNQLALLNAILLNSKAVNYVVTGCGTGMGAMIASNAFPGVQCGFIVDSVDAKLVGEINYVNAVSTAYSKGFGWAGELNLEFMFEQLFKPSDGTKYIDQGTDTLCKGYKDELDYLKKITHTPIIKILEQYDKESLKKTLNNPKFKEYFYQNCKDDEMLKFIKSIID